MSPSPTSKRRPEPAPRSSLADALFTPVLQRVLATVFAQPERRFHGAELIRLAGSGTGATHRVLQRLAASGLLTVTREGCQKYYQANPACPVFPELRGLVQKTVGLVEPLRKALAPVKGRIDAAFVHGSVAAGTDNAHSDVDLLVITDLSQRRILEQLQDAATDLGRPVNAVVMTAKEWRDQAARVDSFIARVRARPRLFVYGSPEDDGSARQPGKSPRPAGGGRNG